MNTKIKGEFKSVIGTQSYKYSILADQYLKTASSFQKHSLIKKNIYMDANCYSSGIRLLEINKNIIHYFTVKTIMYTATSIHFKNIALK